MVTKTIANSSKRTEVKRQIKEQHKKSFNTNSFIITFIIVFIFAYITFDFFVVKSKIQNKVKNVEQKFDSLQIYLDNKLPQIDNAIKVQEQQLKDLQNINSFIINK